MMATRTVATVFGGSGFIGRYVVKRLAQAGHVVRVAVRDTEAARFLKPMGAVGQIVLLRAPVTDPAAVARAVEGASHVVNLVGILAEAREGDFQRVQADGAGNVARAASSAGVARLVHLSAIGADAASPSLYAQSKAAGEAQVSAAVPGAVILRPSVVFGAEDAFFNRFAAMAQLLPVMPVIGGATRLQPVYVGDVADAVMAGLARAEGGVFELGGPRVATLRELQAWILTLIQRNRRMIDVPAWAAQLQARLLERLPGKLLTQDQLKLLSRDNVVAPGVPGLQALGIAPTPMDLVVPQYLARYRPGGRRREDFAAG
jgi:NADH dehydrogenase